MHVIHCDPTGGRVGWVKPTEYAKRPNGVGFTHPTVLTQPYDCAWQQLSRYLHTQWKAISRRRGFDLGKVFPGHTKQATLDIHLYFIKVFGCLIVEGSLPIDISSFSTALRERRAHEEVYLVVAKTPLNPSQKVANVSAVHALNANGLSHAAVWMYTFCPVSCESATFA
jgi:hypothetical protein